MNNWKHWAEIFAGAFALGALDNVGAVLETGHFPSTGHAIGVLLGGAALAGLLQVRRTMMGIKTGVELAGPPSSEVTKP